MPLQNVFSFLLIAVYLICYYWAFGRRSIDSLVTGSPRPASAPRDYQILEGATQRGGDLLQDPNGFTYTVKKRTNTTVTWTCSVRSVYLKCHATVLQKGSNFVAGRHPHVHESVPGEGKKKQLFKVLYNISVVRCMSVMYVDVDYFLCF